MFTVLETYFVWLLCICRILHHENGATLHRMGIDSEKDYSGKFAMGSSVILSHLLLREENYYEDYLAKMRGTQSERMKILYHSSFPPNGSSSFVSADSMEFGIRRKGGRRKTQIQCTVAIIIF